MTRLHPSTHNGHHKAKMMGASTKRLNNKPKALRAEPANDASAAETAGIDSQMRRMMIETAAYFLAEMRRFEPGRELEDWCAAESEVDQRLNATVCWLEQDV